MQPIKIKFIATGGTIDKVYFDRLSEFQVGEPLIHEVLREANVTVDYEVVALLRKDSLDLTPEDRQLIRATIERDACQRFVITHGTDTMIETAKALRGLPGKTIVLTGAMQPARLRNTDAVINLASAFLATQAMPEGVYLAMNGRLFDPEHVRKNPAPQCFEEIATQRGGETPRD